MTKVRERIVPNESSMKPKNVLLVIVLSLYLLSKEWTKTAKFRLRKLCDLGKSLSYNFDSSWFGPFVKFCLLLNLNLHDTALTGTVVRYCKDLKNVTRKLRSRQFDLMNFDNDTVEKKFRFWLKVSQKLQLFIMKLENQTSTTKNSIKKMQQRIKFQRISFQFKKKNLHKNVLSVVW